MFKTTGTELEEFAVQLHSTTWPSVLLHLEWLDSVVHLWGSPCSNVHFSLVSPVGQKPQESAASKKKWRPDKSLNSKREMEIC